MGFFIDNPGNSGKVEGEFTKDRHHLFFQYLLDIGSFPLSYSDDLIDFFVHVRVEFILLHSLSSMNQSYSKLFYFLF